jgi:hypothetical protein
MRRIRTLRSAEGSPDPDAAERARISPSGEAAEAEEGERT